MRRQKTIKQAVVFEGKGIHSGEDVRITIKKAPVDTGVIFIRTDLKDRPTVAANVSNLVDYSSDLRCTSIRQKGVSIYTTEHLMAAFHGLNIDNTVVEVDNAELPVLDGSSLDYAYRLEQTGCIEQEKEKKEIFLNKPVVCSDKDALLIAVPSENFSISCLVKYDGEDAVTQCAHFSFDSAKKKKDIFIEEIAPARTYCLESKIADIKKKGLGKGGSYKNTLVIKDGRPIKNKFRFANELARHKVLDLLGDLTLLNAEIKAHIIGIKSGHTLNGKLLKKLAALM